MNLGEFDQLDSIWIEAHVQAKLCPKWKNEEETQLLLSLCVTRGSLPVQAWPTTPAPSFFSLITPFGPSSQFQPWPNSSLVPPCSHTPIWALPDPRPNGQPSSSPSPSPLSLTLPLLGPRSSRQPNSLPNCSIFSKCFNFLQESSDLVKVD